MEFYRKNNIPIILANVAWSGSQQGVAKWHTEIKPLQSFLSNDSDWPKKFHVWRMDWDSTSIKLYLDDLLLNITPLSETVNPDGKNPFLQPHYILLNLAIGSSGGDPSESLFPIKYEVDYVRVYQTK
jgi:beta-glucanase (GH16 family)